MLLEQIIFLSRTPSRLKSNRQQFPARRLAAVAAFLLYLRLSAHFFLSFPFLQKESRVLVHRRRNLLDRVFSFFSHFDLLNCCVFIMKQEILKFDSSRLLMPPFCCNVYQEQYPIKIIDATSYYTHSYKLQNRITLQREISSFFRLSWS